jgi:hypothetical protein
MKTLILMSFLLISQAWGQGITLPEGVSAEGQLRLYCASKSRTRSFERNVDTRIEISNFGEGKKRISIFGEYTKEYESFVSNSITEPFSLNLVGIENGLGGFDLYHAKEKKFDKNIGELVLFGKSLSINFVDNLHVTNGSLESRELDCELITTGVISYNVVKPKCYNRRGKIKKCPVIKF